MQERLDALVSSISDRPPQTALMVGVISGEQRSTYAYGSLDGRLPGGSTVFEIGSVAKVFTTALLATLIQDGRLALDQPAAELAPELRGYPAGVTLRRLATHTAGLPKMPGNILRSLLKDRSNPYAAYTEDQLLRWVVRHPPSPNQLEAGLVSYSNLGMGLLGTLLGRKLGMTYEEAVRMRICEPLGMGDTGIRLPPDQAGRLAPPHNSRGRAAHSWDLPAFAGAGALRSTADDLLAFVDAQLGSAPAVMARALEGTHEVQGRRFATPGLLPKVVARLSGYDPATDRTHGGMALGWTVGHLSSVESAVHWHHGATGGYRAFVGFARSAAAGVVVLANSGPSMRDGLIGTTATDRLGFAVLGQLASAD